MTNIPDDELISAYLDGELSGEELARAERLLATQPDARQMLEELTALRASLRELPKHELGPGFAESVLRRAEREMLVPSATIATPRRSDEGTPSPAPRPPILSWARWQRPLIWSGLAVAAALLIMFLSPDERQPVQVAQAPAPADGEMGAAGAPAALEARPQLARGQDEADSASRVDRFGLYVRDSERSPEAEAAATGAADASPQNLAQRLVDQDGLPLDAFLAHEAEQPAKAGALLVRCDVSPQVAGSDAFARLLSQQRIEWQGEPQSGKSGEAARKLARAEETELAAVKSQADSKRAPEQQHAVYVEAAPEQLQATLAALATSSEFRDVTVSQLPADADQSTLFYHASPSAAKPQPAAPAVPAAVAAPSAPPSGDVAGKAETSSGRYKASGRAAGRGAKEKQNAAGAAAPAEGAAPEGRQELFAAKAQTLRESLGRAYRVPIPTGAQLEQLGDESARKERRDTAEPSQTRPEPMQRKPAQLGVDSKPAAPPQRSANEDYNQPDSRLTENRESTIRGRGDQAARSGGRKSTEQATSHALFIFRIVPEAAAAAPSQP